LKLIEKLFFADIELEEARFARTQKGNPLLFDSEGNQSF
jgi:hypothetical protein